MSGPRVAIQGVGLWLPGYPSTKEWVAGTKDPETPAPQGRGFHRALRRRAGLLGRAIADASDEAMTQAEADPKTIATVVGSSVGEVDTMIGLLDRMWREQEPMSPAAFTVSVHNAASGLLSISNKNQGYTTSLAADENTPAVAILEAIGLVIGHQTPVLVVCADESVPASIAKETPPWDPLAAAIVLAPTSAGSRTGLHFGITRDRKADQPPAEVEEIIANNPQAGMLDLVDAILRRRLGATALDRGTGHGYVALLEEAT